LVLFAVGLVCALVIVIVAGAYAYTKTDDIASLPCLGCLGLDPAKKGIEDFTFDQVEGWEHPVEVMERLKENVLFLHFRTRDCPGCDQIEPTIEDIDEEYAEVVFAHVHILYEGDYGDLVFPEDDELKALRTYDIMGENAVPMMVIITLNEDDDGVVRPYFNTLYGAGYTHQDFQDMLDAALELHSLHVHHFEV
jgi:thiol-disulfide isomerase/thioredoxin